MLELIVNSSFSTIVVGPVSTNPTDAVLYLNDQVSTVTPSFTPVSGTTDSWVVTFVPNSTGVYSLYVFGAIQFRAQSTSKSLYTYLGNIEDESLGSWTWDKTSGLLTMYRQNGTVLATYTVLDNLSTSSRERVS